MPRDTRARFLKALKAQDAAIYRAFVDAMNDARNSVNIARLEAALEAGNAGEVLRVVGIGPQAFDGVQEAIRTAFYAGASYHIALAPKVLQASLELSFQRYHPRIVGWIEANAARRVAEVTNDIRGAISVTIARGFEQQRGYRAIALDIVGRLDGNRRVGGVIGLLEREAAYVANARRQLLDLDPAYFQRRLRDKRFDRAIAKAIQSGKPLPAAMIDNATARYSSRLLKERGRRIARTEGNGAMAAGRDEHIQQLIDRGEAQASDITGKWNHTARQGQRDNHAAMNGETRAYGERYSNGMLRPHDPAAGAAENANCGCFETTVTDWVAVARRRGTL